MPTSNLLNTSTISLKGLLANGRTYSVPPYQRDYAWKEEHWEDLWQDLCELEAPENSQHYMGSIVLKEASPEHFVIIDGQQRLATLSILVLAVIAAIKKLARAGQEGSDNERRHDLLRQAYIGATDPGSLTYASKLTLNSTDNGFYQQVLVQLERPASERKLGDSERLLWEAFKYFLRKVDERFSKTSGKELADWINLKVSVQLLFIQVSVESEVSAYTVFETLNARGLELTTSDLLKNYLMSLVAPRGRGDLDHVLARWKSVSDTIGIRRLPEFLRHHFNSRHAFIRQERLFKAMRGKVKNGEDVIALLRDLESAAVCYDALDDPEDDYWLDYPGATRQVRALVLFGVTQYKPLILAAREKLSPQDLVYVLRICAIISFRFNVISRLGRHELENRYNEAALAIQEGRAKSLAEVRAFLKPVYVDDEHFRADFEIFRLPAKSSKDKALIRYVLCELERQHSGQDIAAEASEATLEHVLPLNPGEHWAEAFTSDDHERYSDRLGNYTLLEKKLNMSEAGNKGFADKQRIYAASQYALTRKLGELSDWNPESLKERQVRLAKLATAVWKLPVVFPD